MQRKDYSEARKKILAAQSLLLEQTASSEKLRHLRTLLKDIDPNLESVLERAENEISRLENIFEGDVISLTAGNLPEHTEKHKKRKKAVLLFLETWKKLQSEVARVGHELAANGTAQAQGQHTSPWGKIFKLAKGPLGIITVAAVGIALVMQAVSVQVAIKNQNCDTMVPSISIPFALPGLSLPKNPIPSGESATATIPGLTFTIDGTQPGTLSVKALTFSMIFDLSGGLKDVQLDGVTLLKKKTIASLSNKKQHELTFICGR